MSCDHLATAANLTGAAPTYKLLLFALGYHADSHGRVRTSLGELIDTTGLSERSIRTWLKAGAKRGALIQDAAEPYHIALL